MELVRSNQQLRQAEEQLRKRSEQVQNHRDVLLELAQSDKSNLDRALQRICSISAATLDVARVSYWSVLEDDSGISCEVLYLRNKDSFDQEFKGRRLGFAQYPEYFEELSAKRPIVANDVLAHPATGGLAESYLKPLGISSLLDAPVWECGEGVGVLRHEHVGPPRDWSAEESTLFRRSRRWCHWRCMNQIARRPKNSCTKARRGCARARSASAEPFVPAQPL